MSEQGWRAFLEADGLDDWVVLHGGATAVFRVTSLVAAAQLADAVAGVPDVQGVGILLTLADDRVSVRLTRGVFRLGEGHVELARAVSATARSQGAVADRAAVQEVQLAVAAKPDTVDVGFWRAVLGYEPLAEGNGVDPLATVRRCECRTLTLTSRCGTRCTSTCQLLASRSAPASPLRLLQVASWSTKQPPPTARSSRTALATASASSRGRMAPWLTTLMMLMMLGNSAVKRVSNGTSAVSQDHDRRCWTSLRKLEDQDRVHDARDLLPQRLRTQPRPEWHELAAGTAR